MSFQACPCNIQAKTGKTLADFQALAVARGFAGPEGWHAGGKPARITDWLQADFDLGHGPARTVVALLKGKKD